ncbi:MAG: 3-hydroxyacyl-ACP dehydratase [Polaromonas sp.]
MPILPGVVLLDAALHALLEAERVPCSTGNEDSTAPACHISAAKFLSPVEPGESLTISYRTSASGSTHFEISGTNRKVAEGTLMLPLAS